MKLIKVLNKRNVASMVATHLAQQHLGPLTNQTLSPSSLQVKTSHLLTITIVDTTI
jgi:hypothetical protein